MHCVAIFQLDFLDSLLVLQDSTLEHECQSARLKISFLLCAELLHLLDCGASVDLDFECFASAGHFDIDFERHCDLFFIIIKAKNVLDQFT